jgi:hypothetical protein
LQPPPPGRTISLVGTQLSDPTHIYNTKKRLRPLLRSTRSHALPRVGAAARTVDRQTRRTRPAHKDHQKLPHRPKVTPHRPRAQHRAIWQPSPTAHHQRNQQIQRRTEQEGAPSNHTWPPHPHPLTARCKRPPRCEPLRRLLHRARRIPAGRRNNMDSERPNPRPHGIRTMEPHPKIYPIRGGPATTHTAKLENGPLPQRSHDHTVGIERRRLPSHSHAAPSQTLPKLDPTRPSLRPPPGGWPRKRSIHTRIPGPAPAGTAGTAGSQGSILGTLVSKGISNLGQGSGAGRQRNPTTRPMVIKRVPSLHRLPPRASLPNRPPLPKLTRTLSITPPPHHLGAAAAVGRVQVERRPQRRPPLPPSGTSVLRVVYCFVLV